MTRIVCVGEGMLEISGPLNGPARFSYGGDTLNTAIYLARLGHDVQFLSALGEDTLSQDMRAAWRDEGLGLDLVLTHPTRQPGLYAIRTNAEGERSFQYWRSESAARDMFALLEIDAALKTASSADLLYLSGITLSLFDSQARARLLVLAKAVCASGGCVAFDPNYRPRLWASVAEAREAFAAIAPHVSIALPTLEDEHALHGDANAEATTARWADAGAQEVVVKLGPEGAFVWSSDGVFNSAQKRRVSAVDTTGAGDSFNAAYLSARFCGASPIESADAGNALAALVIAHPGAIIPRSAMPPKLEHAS